MKICNRLLLLIVLLVSGISCAYAQSGTIYASPRQDTFPLDPNFEYIFNIPEEKRTEQHKKALFLILDVITSNIKAVNGEMILDITEEEFVAKGLAKQYYHREQHNIKVMNEFVKTNNLQSDVPRLVKEARESFLKHYK